jgi:hypothetical protein
MSKISYRRNVKTSYGGLRAESEPVSACVEQDEQGETRLTRATKKQIASKNKFNE